MLQRHLKQPLQTAVLEEQSPASYCLHGVVLATTTPSISSQRSSQHSYPIPRNTHGHPRHSCKRASSEIRQDDETLGTRRSVHHNSPSHRSGAYWNLTGHEPPNPTGNWPATRDDWPSLGSMVWQALGDGHGAIPGAVALPYTLYDGGTAANGQDGGFLGLVRDPAVIRPNSSTPLKMYGGRSPTSGHVQLELPEQVDLQRLERRRSLIDSFENSSTGNPNEGQATIRLRETALDMLLDPKVSDAFDIEQEPTHLRSETYGMHICGQSALMARRLTETGIPSSYRLLRSR